MFNDKFHLTESVLSGIKTQTRRLIKINEQILNDFNIEYYNNTLDVIEDKKELIKTYIDNNPSKVPYHIGDLLRLHNHILTVDINAIHIETLMNICLYMKMIEIFRYLLQE